MNEILDILSFPFCVNSSLFVKPIISLFQNYVRLCQTKFVFARIQKCVSVTVYILLKF